MRLYGVKMFVEAQMRWKYLHPQRSAYQLKVAQVGAKYDPSRETRRTNNIL